MKNAKATKAGNTKKAGNTIMAMAGTAAIIIGALFLVYGSAALFPPIYEWMGMHSRESYAAIRLILSYLVLGMSTILIYTYLKDYLELRGGSFPLGLVLVMVSFFMYGLTSSPITHMTFGMGTSSGPFTFIPLVFTTIALGILLWISSK